jgi:trimeric autotransporter adhesin
MKKGFSLVCLMVIFLLQGKAATITSGTNGGNWNATTTWVGGTVPTSSDVVIIAGNVSINAHAVCQRLTVNSGKTLSFAGAYTLTIQNNNWNQTCITNYGTFTTTNGTIKVMSNDAGLDIASGTIVIEKLILSNVRANFSSGTTVNTSLTLTNGAYISGTHPAYGSNATLEIAQSFSLNGNYYLWASGSGNNVAPNILISSGTVTAEQVDMYIKNSLTVLSGATLNGGAVCMYLVSGFSAITNNGTARLGGISVLSGATWNINSNVTISTLKIERNGVVNAGSYTLTIDNSARNNCNISGDILNIDNGGAFNAGTGTVVFIPAFWSDLDAGNGSNQIVFNNIVVSGNSTLNIPNSSSIAVNGNIAINNGATINQPQNITLTPTTTVSNGGSTTNGSFPSTVTVSPSGTTGGGAVNASRWTVINPNAFTVTSNLSFTGSPKVVTVQEGAILDAAGYTISCDTVYIQGTFATSNTNGLSGTFGSAVVIIGNSSTVTFSANSGTQTITPRTDYVNLKLSGNSTKNFSNATYEISGNFEVTGSAPVYGTSTVMRFDGTTQTISCPSFNNVEFTNAGTKTLGVATQVINTLTLAGNAVLESNNNLTLVSNASGTARVATIPATASITGNVTVQRYVPSVARRSRMISPNVVNFTFADIKDDIFVTGAGGAANGFDASGPNQTTVYTYQESGSRGWKAITNINNTLPAGKGALVFVRGDRTLPAPQWYTAPYVPQNEVTIDFTGTLNQGTIAPSLTYTNTGSSSDDGWNMVGNPYPSQINWSSVTKNNLSAFYYVYDPSTGSYVAKSGNSYIASGQAFFVQATAANPSITFNESNKVANSSISYFKTSDLPFEVRMVKDSVNADIAWLSFNNNATVRYTPEEDALKMTNSAINLGFYIDSVTLLQYNAVPEVEKADSFTLSATAANGTYTLTFANTDRTGKKLMFIKDLFTNNVIDLQNTSSYTFTITSNAASKGNRFKLIVVDPTNLPVSWLGFSARKEKAGVQLTWSTASEKNNSGFSIEKAEQGSNDWSAIGFVGGKGNSNTVSNYSFVDGGAFAQSDVVYYRIKQIDLNGTVSYSKIITLHNDKATEEVAAATVYPNPAQSDLYADFATGLTDATLEVTDSYGKLLLVQQHVNGLNQHVNVASLPAGVYVLKVSQNGAAIHTSKFVKH